MSDHDPQKGAGPAAMHRDTGAPGGPAAASPRETEAPGTPLTLEIDESGDDLDQAMREALAAVESVQHGAAGAGQDGAAAAEAAAQQSEISALRRENAELRDRSVRAMADFDNFRKRADRERQDTRRYALLEPLREFLPIADNLDRALQAGGAAEDLKRGVEMIQRQMLEVLRRLGVREVPAAGEVFNPAVHEAVARIETADVAVPTVAETLVPGYTLHDRLLRPAMVKVAVPAERSAGTPEGGA